MAALKEAIAIVLDVGKFMHNGKTIPTILDQAKQCINMIVQRKIFSESKDEISLILFGTDETSNDLNEHLKNSSQYSNIKIVQEFTPANWDLLDYVKNIEGTDVSSDFIDALVVAMDRLYIKINDKKEKVASSRILFFSNFRSAFSADKIGQICNALKSKEMELNIIGPYAFSTKGDEETKDVCKKEDQISEKAEKYICQILKEVNGESYSFNEVLPALIYYQKKKIKPTPWNANLDIGTDLTIPVSGYTKVTEYKSKSWKSAYAHKLSAKIERGCTYIMQDEKQTKVNKEDVIPAFKYGTTLVPFSEEDRLNMNYQSGERGMKVLGFTKAGNVERYHYSGDKSMYVFGQGNRELSGVILAPFIQALHDTKMVAIVRYVYSPRSAPKIGFLSPKIKENYECLVFVVLPFMEDLRHLLFTPLNSDLKNVPTEEQLNAVDSLITAMDLTVPVDEDQTELMKPNLTVNPYLQKLYQCLQHKAFNPEKPLADVFPHINALVIPDPKLVKRAQSSLKKIQSDFLFKEFVPKKAAETENLLLPSEKSDAVIKKEKISGDSDADFTFNVSETVTDKITGVGSVNPIRDFQYLITQKILPFEDACKQMTSVLFQFLKDSENIKLYHSKVLTMCKELRRASLKAQKPDTYNSFMVKLQNALLECDSELWDKIKSEKLGLITKSEVPSSLVSNDQAEEFFSASSMLDDKDSAEADNVAEQEEDFDDLMDQL